MEPSFSSYIWKHTRPQQLWVLLIVLVSMLPYYLALDLPRQIVNGPIQGGGFETPQATQTFMPTTIDLPGYGTVSFIGGMQLDRMETLVGLSMVFLGLVIVNGLFKYYINIYKGLLGERLLRRIRFELVDRILRFPPKSFKHLKSGEVASMVKDEVEPLGGFTGDAFVQPAMLGGQALTALAFIFVQNVWLGMVALFMAGVQFVIIPRLRVRLIELGRERQVTARQLSGRVAEIVEGIGTIHAYDTSNYERADVASRLGQIFRIRYELYQRKFLVKFLNNFLAQVTPFLFYLIGGYFTIQGSLDVGQLVAVINAYKELPGPLKELIDWDLQRQDVQVKYEQVVEQFQSDSMIDAGLTALDPSHEARLALPLVLNAVTVQDDSGGKRLDRVSLRVEPGETVAIVGDAISGADALAETIARLAPPSSGKVTLGDQDLYHLTEAVSGRRITYAGTDTYFFFGSMRDNLLYGLKHAPLRDMPYEGPAAKVRRRAVMEAKKSGNPDFDPTSEWIDPESATALSNMDGLLGSMMAVLGLVRLSDQVMEFAMFSTFDVTAEPELAEQILLLRTEFREELERMDMGALVTPFEEGSYNPEARVVDNLLFGVFPDVKNAAMAEGTAYFDRMIQDSGLGEQLFAMGLVIAETTVDLFRDLPADNPFFERLGYMEPDDLPRIAALIDRLKGVSYVDAEPADRMSIIRLSYLYVEPQYRFGVLDEPLMRRIVEVREAFHLGLPTHLQPLLQTYGASKYLSAANLIDNIVFGKVNHRLPDADRRIREIVTGLLQSRPRLFKRIFAVGLDYNLGAAGRRLTVQQRQKLNFARALIRRSDYYVFNRALSALDARAQEQILRDTLKFLDSQGDSPAIIWVLANPSLRTHFQRVVEISDGTIVEATADETETEEVDTVERRLA